MPSVGMRSVGCVHLRATAASSRAGVFFDTSNARSWVWKRLTTSSRGAFSSADHSAYSMPAPYCGSVAGSMTFALPDHVLACGF